MRRKYSTVAIALLLTTTALMPACQSADLKKAAQASQDIAVSIKLAITTKDDLAKQGLISNAEALKIDQILLVLNQADQVFIAKAQGYTNFDATAKAQLAKLFVDITSGITQLQGAAGTLLNAQAKQALTVVVTSLNVAAATLQAVLGV